MAEAKSSDQSDALILGPGDAISDHDSPPDDAVDPSFEDLRHADGGDWRLRKLDPPHLNPNDRTKALKPLKS